MERRAISVFALACGVGCIGCIGLNPDYVGGESSTGTHGESDSGEDESGSEGESESSSEATLGGDGDGDGDGDGGGDGDGDENGDGDGDGEVGSVDVRVAASSDDAEENLAGEVYVSSPDLELVDDYEIWGPGQRVGMRFASVAVPVGATITSAHVEFVALATTDDPTSLEFVGEADPNPSTFAELDFDIDARARTLASILWADVPPWTADEPYVSPDLAPIIQELVDDLEWSEGNAIVLMVEGSGYRLAQAYDGSASEAPLLHIDWSLP